MKVFKAGSVRVRLNEVERPILNYFYPDGYKCMISNLHENTV